MRHPWRFYPAFAGQFTAASKGGEKIQIRASNLRFINIFAKIVNKLSRKQLLATRSQSFHQAEIPKQYSPPRMREITHSSVTYAYNDPASQ